MDKLSERLSDVLYETIGSLSQVEEDIIKAGLERLAAYEETDLLPEQVVKMGLMFEDSKRYSGRLELKLKPYLDIGLSPSELNALKLASMGKCVVEIKEFDGVTIDRLRELACAEKDGRVLTPPCMVGQTVYFVLRDTPFFYPGTRGWYISENVVTEVCTRGFCIDDIEDDEPISFYPNSIIGVDVFLSREDADADLERRLK